MNSNLDEEIERERSLEYRIQGVSMEMEAARKLTEDPRRTPLEQYLASVARDLLEEKLATLMNERDDMRANIEEWQVEPDYFDYIGGRPINPWPPPTGEPTVLAPVDAPAPVEGSRPRASKPSKPWSEICRYCSETGGMHTGRCYAYRKKWGLK